MRQDRNQLKSFIVHFSVLWLSFVFQLVDVGHQFSNDALTARATIVRTSLVAQLAPVCRDRQACWYRMRTCTR